MTTYLAFLRAINLGKARKFPKDDIRRAVESVGFADVETYINTGNVRFTSSMRSRERIEERLEAAFLADRGFDVPTVVYSAAEFAELAREARSLTSDALARHYVYLLKDEPTDAVRSSIEDTSGPLGDMVVRGRAAHALLRPGYADGVVDPLHAAKLLGVATSRNVTVVAALAQKWCGA